MKNTSKNIITFLQTIFWILFAAFIIFFAVTSFSEQIPNLPYKFYLIQSGSMEPSIMTGDVIISKPQAEYTKNDVITYRDHGGRVVTHRILEVLEEGGGEAYKTKGDANQDIDPVPIPKEEVIGEVQLAIPKLGYLLVYAKTKAGMVLLVVVPATIMIYDELRKMKKEVES